jgi:hypothetical protein
MPKRGIDWNPFEGSPLCRACLFLRLTPGMPKRGTD